ncbi:MAG TPA: hypothetical protein ENH62_06155 [Marinobacter sp.]|uniref:Bacteriophage head to tail connecting protein n=1 Tax=marine sediment metagenome TaxID=412755 RepID=A0A0F9R7G5_9ZZZZ|nr:hypothetical protein [Marinobacter sp.]
MADESRVEEILVRRTALRSRRGLWSTMWDDLARVQLPRRLGFVTQTSEGDRKTEDIFDGTPMQAARALANALGAMLRPEGEKWHRIRAVEDIDEASDEASEWFADTDERMRDAFENPKSRMRQALGEADADLIVLGTAVVFTGEGDRNLLFQTLHLKDALPFFGESGNPEGMLRDKRFTIRQAVSRFGREKLSESIKQQIENKKWDDYVNFVHAVLPRDEGRKEANLARNLPWADLWIELDEKKLLTSGGFHEFPFAVPRWDTSAGEEYGRSPGMIALPDSETAQAMQSTLLVAGQRAADPPLAVPDDSTFDAPNTYPGGLVYYDIESARAVGRMPIVPLETGGNIPLTRDMQHDIREQIWNAFFRNILRLPVGGPQMTATEILARKEEFIREIGPVFGRLETDYTAPIVERSFNIMLRAGALAPIPEVLQGRGVRFEYQSPIKRLRQQVEAAAARAWAEEMIFLGELKPEALDLINVDALGRFSAEAAGLPHNIVNGTDEVERLRQERAAAQAAAAEAEQLAAGVDTASTVTNMPGVKEALEGVAT